MRLDRIGSDIAKAIRRIAQIFDNNVTVNDNFGPSGVPKGWTIVSEGRLKLPKWAPADTLQTSTGSQAVGQDGVDGAPGTPGGPGAPGADGPPGPAGDTLGHWEPLAFDGALVFDSEGDIVMGWIAA